MNVEEYRGREVLRRCWWIAEFPDDGPMCLRCSECNTLSCPTEKDDDEVGNYVGDHIEDCKVLKAWRSSRGDTGRLIQEVERLQKLVDAS
jgi:hypothetical protein